VKASARVGHLTVEYDDHVLRPRPWTAEQAQWAARLDDGVGHIGLLLANLVGRAVVLVDADPIACDHARRNAEVAGVDAEVRRAPLADALADDERFAVVLADPPWVPTGEVGRYPDDPVSAIDGGTDGLDVARACVEVMGRHLLPGGIGILQLGTLAQARALEAELREQPSAALRVVEVRDVARANGVLVRLTGVDGRA
jgi:release factor glutamine methyltransferase